MAQNSESDFWVFILYPELVCGIALVVTSPWLSYRLVQHGHAFLGIALLCSAWGGAWGFVHLVRRKRRWVAYVVLLATLGTFALILRGLPGHTLP